jgi:ferredoxin
MRISQSTIVALLALASSANSFTLGNKNIRSQCHSKTFLSSSSSSEQQRTIAGKEVSPLSYAAAGSPTVDMNKYNIPMEQAVDEWTAVLQAESSMQEEGIFLQPKNKRDLFVDCLQYKMKREGGLGLILTEIAGGREDGVGITIVEELLEGGNAEQSGIVPGDSIVALTVNKSSKENMVVDEERIDVSTECLAYDPTIEALTSLPPPASSEDEIILTVKRIRRQPKVNVKLQYPPAFDEPDATIELFSGENLRRAMLTRGIKLNDKFSERFDNGGTGDCGADGTCATCVISVTKGIEMLSPMGIQESQILSKKPRWRMACKAVVGYGMEEGDMTIQVSPRQWSK